MLGEFIVQSTAVIPGRRRRRAAGEHLIDAVIPVHEVPVLGEQGIQSKIENTLAYFRIRAR